MNPQIAVLTVGDELLSGELADTNTAAIARLLGAHGFAVREALTVPDDEEAVAAALLRLVERWETVVVTGGLGPTEDDLTARAAARAFRRHLALSDEALRLVREHFRRTGREMHPANEKQALLPQKAQVLANPRGTAPGFVLQVDTRELYFLPGVPDEMQAMLLSGVLPRLRERCGDAEPGAERIFKLHGLAEPRIEELLGEVTLPAGVSVAFGVDFPLVHLKLRAAGGHAVDLLDRAEVPVRRLFGKYLAAVGDETLPGNVARLLTGAGLTLGVAESCTGGLVSTMLTDIPGASAFLERSAVTYANSAKTSWLKIPTQILEKEGAVSETCARLMARGIRRAAQSDLGLAVTGIAGPDGGTPQKPVGTVFIALCDGREEPVRRYQFAGDRAAVRRQSACMALDWLRRYLVAHVAGERDDG